MRKRTPNLLSFVLDVDDGDIDSAVRSHILDATICFCINARRYARLEARDQMEGALNVFKRLLRLCGAPSPCLVRYADGAVRLLIQANMSHGR